MSRLLWEIEFLDEDGAIERIEAIRQERFRPEWIREARSGAARLHLVEVLGSDERRCLMTISKETPH